VDIVSIPDGLILDLPWQTRERVLAHLDQFIIAEDVEISDLTLDVSCLAIQGPAAMDERFAGIGEAASARPPVDHTGEGGLNLYVPSDRAEGLWRRLMDAGARPVGQTAAETLRIETGIPLYGADMDGTTIPLEAGLGPAHISDRKGCYI